MALYTQQGPCEWMHCSFGHARPCSCTWAGFWVRNTSSEHDLHFTMPVCKPGLWFASWCGVYSFSGMCWKCIVISRTIQRLLVLLFGPFVNILVLSRFQQQMLALSRGMLQKCVSMIRHSIVLVVLISARHDDLQCP